LAKTDRRVRRTRELLRSALHSLIEEKGYDSITVQDILDRADVGRSTFYAHYRDKEDLLRSGFEDIRSALAAERDAAATAGQSHVQFLQPTLVVFQHVGRYRHQWKSLVRKGGADLVIRILRESATDLVREHFRCHFPAEKGNQTQMDAAVQFVVGALMGLLSWWLDNDVTYSAEEIYSICRRLTTQGVRRFVAAR
jgi:AcrR family transcriptional regulator